MDVSPVVTAKIQRSFCQFWITFARYGVLQGVGNLKFYKGSVERPERRISSEQGSLGKIVKDGGP